MTVTKTITVAAGVFAQGRAAGATISFQDPRVARRLVRQRRSRDGHGHHSQAPAVSRPASSVETEKMT
jgi:hypothetical protein